MKAPKKKVELIFAIVAVLAALGGFLFFRHRAPPQPSAPSLPQQPVLPAIPTPDLVSKKDLKIPAGEIVELIKQKNWSGLDQKFSKKQDPEKIENLLSQIIYSLDTKLISEIESEYILKALFHQLERPAELQPRARILISKIFGKLTPSELQKKEITKKYQANQWLDKIFWLDVSIAWAPMRPSTLKLLNGLFKTNRSDLLADYFYYLSKISSKKILNQHIKGTVTNIAKFSSQQQAYIKKQISLLESNSNLYD